MTGMRGSKGQGSPKHLQLHGVGTMHWVPLTVASGCNPPTRWSCTEGDAHIALLIYHFKEARVNVATWQWDAVGGQGRRNPTPVQGVILYTHLLHNLYPRTCSYTIPCTCTHVQLCIVWLLWTEALLLGLDYLGGLASSLQHSKGW